MTVRQDTALLEIAASLAWSAAELILAYRARGCPTETKADASVVTEADRQSESLIVKGLREATPEIEVVAEEEISAGHVPAACGTMWMIDPLDGTRDFVALRDGFTVNIGLVRDRRPVLGVVAVPASAELFGGVVGCCAWKQDGAGRHPIRVRSPPPAGLAVLSSRYSPDDPGLLAALGNVPVASIRHLGSALKFCRLAEGTADAYVRLGRTMEWDTAGPEAVLLSAGGTLRLLDGSTLAYGKPGWANPPFMCRGGA